MFPSTSSSSNQGFEGNHQKSQASPEQAAREETNDQRDDSCWQNEQQDFGDEYDYHDSDDKQQEVVERW